jgi:cytochrome c oxidase cbb3-type subunit 3
MSEQDKQQSPESTEHKGDYIPDDPILDHNYDGIREADNPLPTWWVNLFIISVVFAIVYVPVAHMFNFVPHAELQRDIKQAKLAAEAREAELVASGYYDRNPIEAGQKYFKTFCATCHGEYGEGGLCPNLTDAFWIREPTEEVITQTIMNGVPDKGMPTWLPILGERKIQMIAAYVMTLWESEPPVPGKKAEGDEYDMTAYRQPADADTTAAAADSVETATGQSDTTSTL